MGLFAGQLGWRGPFWDWLGGLDLNTVGFVVVGIFVVTWAVALLVWRYGRIEEKWAPAAETNELMPIRVFTGAAHRVYKRVHGLSPESQ